RCRTGSAAPAKEAPPNGAEGSTTGAASRKAGANWHSAGSWNHSTSDDYSLETRELEARWACVSRRPHSFPGVSAKPKEADDFFRGLRLRPCLQAKAGNRKVRKLDRNARDRHRTPYKGVPLVVLITISRPQVPLAHLVCFSSRALWPKHLQRVGW